jgi:hypothetical protein
VKAGQGSCLKTTPGYAADDLADHMRGRLREAGEVATGQTTPGTGDISDHVNGDLAN